MAFVDLPDARTSGAAYLLQELWVADEFIPVADLPDPFPDYFNRSRDFRGGWFHSSSLSREQKAKTTAHGKLAFGHHGKLYFTV